MNSLSTLLPASLAALSLTLLLLAMYLAWPWLTALAGRATMRRKLAALEKRGCRVMHHVLLPTRSGDAALIDHLVFAPEGIFVVSAVARAGAVHGSLRDAMWVQEHHGRQSRFPNPLRANAAQVDIVQSILGRKLPIRGVVVFEAGHLSGTLPDNVIRPGAMEEWVQAHGGERKMSDGALRRLIAAIENVALPDEAGEGEAALLAQQGLESRLNLARGLALASAVLMVSAVGAAGWFFTRH